MPEWLSDPAWQTVIAIVLGVAAIVVSVLIYLLQRNRKDLSYEVLTEASLLKMGDQITNELKIDFRGKPVSNLHLLEIRFINSGNASITPSDFVEPLEIYFPFTSNNTGILTADIENTNPKDLSVPLRGYTPNEEFMKTEKGGEAPQISAGFAFTNAQVSPVLLNKGDSFTVKMLVAEYSGKFLVKARIVGVKDVKQKEKLLINYKLILAVIGLLAFAIVLIGDTSFTIEVYSILDLVGLLVAIPIAIFFLVSSAIDIFFGRFFQKSEK